MDADDGEWFASDPDSYLTNRVKFKTLAYTKKGDRYRWGYLIISLLGTIAAAVVPVLINIADVPKIYPTLLSLLVTILVGFEGIIHFREHWKNYDLMKTFLRREGCLFRAKAGPYRGLEPDAAFAFLVERVEDEIARERAQTIQMRTAQSENAGQKDGANKGKTD